MIAPDLADNIINVIGWHSTWVTTRGFGDFGETACIRANRLVTVRCRVLKLEVRVKRRGFLKKQCINIPEFSIENAIKTLSVKSEFRSHVARRTLSCHDVSEIVRLASNNTIPLELEEDSRSHAMNAAS